MIALIAAVILTLRHNGAVVRSLKGGLWVSDYGPAEDVRGVLVPAYQAQDGDLFMSGLPYC